MSELLLDVWSTWEDGWWPEAYSKLISGMVVLGQLETLKNQQKQESIISGPRIP